jgi:hypothetical protein
MSTIAEARWQPVVLMLNRRMDCSCGALATIVTGTIPDDQGDIVLRDADSWCQDCFNKASQEEWERQQDEQQST